MPTTIITPHQIQQATLRIECGDEYGSGFFISNTLILTARHVIIDAIDEEQPIQIFLGTMNCSDTQSPIICTLLADGGEELDIALLQVPIKCTDFALPLFSCAIRYNARWEIFGYPFEHQISGKRYMGSVSKTNIDKPYDIELINDSIDNQMDYRGLSGSALVIENEVVGVVTYNIMDGFGAVSISKISFFLENLNVSFRIQQEVDDLPDNLKEDMVSAIPNAATIALLHEKLIDGGKYYVLHGSPGSGKTLICATYQFSDINKVIAGRYFIRLPNDARSLSYRVSREAFLEWIEDMISQKLTGSVYPKQSVSWIERVKKFQTLLTALNEYYNQRNEVGYIIVDGLDDINANSQNGLAEFLSLFPETLPNNLSFLLAIIRKDSLPPFIQSLISPAEEVKVTPLEIDQCTFYLRDKLKMVEPEISFTILQKISEKSEGHPLYLRYLVEQLKDNRALDLVLWIDQLPTINSDIARYYERIWLTDFATDQEKLWIALIVSQLRQPVTRTQLLQMLPKTAHLAFVTKFPAIRHLFKVNGRMGIYHSSFGLFIEQKSYDLLPVAHEYISSFCNNAKTDVYSITNILYHILQSNNPMYAITHCDQEWADACAKISVEPDLVLSDIARVEIYCLEHGHFTNFIRVKLLLQRIRFRYDNVLAKNAAAIARVLLAMGNPTDALKYLVRFSVLLISDEEALRFLQKFNQINASQEAVRLLKAIEGRIQALYENAKEKNVIPFRIFSLMAKSKTLDLVNNPKQSMLKVTDILQTLKGFSEDDINTREIAKDIHLLRQEIGSYYKGFLTYYSKDYTKMAAILKEKMPQIPEAEWAGGIAHNAIAFNLFLENDKTTEEININNELIEDIEYAIDNFGYLQKDAEFLYVALLENSKRPEILKKLIQDMNITPLADNLRANNGVDADIHFLRLIINYQENIGYLDESDIYPEQRALFDSVWERGLLDSVKLIGFCFGKAWRLRSESKMDKIDEILNHLSNMLLRLDFTLKERSSWKRSYAIPEQIFPHIYSRLAWFYIEFSPENLEGFIKLILAKTSTQLGLYTEGFRNVLSSIASKLSRSAAAAQLTVNILKKLEEHVLLATQNRWERIPALLEIAEIYAKLGNNEKAMQVYQQMLDTSMGPTWYKEDQFSLINTVLSLPSVGDHHLLFQDFSKQLEFAAGELTFQRFARVAQETFIANMARQGKIADAISYYQYQTLPDPLQIIANAERSTVDAIKLGDGYVLGTRNIVEASGIINLLNHTDADPVLIWAFTEVFFINHDTFRYIREYATLQAECLVKVSSEQASFELLFFRQRLQACVLHTSLDSYRNDYLKDLMDHLPQQEYNLLVSSLSGSGINFPQPKLPAKERTPEEDAIYDDFTLPGMGKQSNFRLLPKILSSAQQHVEMENKSAAAKTLANGLLLLHHGKSDIWMGSKLNKDVGELWKQLQHITSIPEILQLIKEPITNHYTQDWRVVGTLIRVLKAQLNVDQAKEILEIVKNHTHLMIRDPKNIEGFNWKYVSKDVGSCNNDLLIDLLIWLLDHPYVSVKKRVIQTLLMICEIRPIVISRLLEKTLSDDNSVVREICTYLLYCLSSKQPTLLKTINFNTEIKQKMLQEKHFMIKYYFLKILQNLKFQHASISEFYQDLILSFPETVSRGADVYFDEPYINLIENIIISFEKLNMLNHNFCRDFLDKINALSSPLTIYDQFRAGHYLERSYHDDEVHYRRGVHILRQAFNLAISSRVTRGTIEQAAAILQNDFLYEN